MSTPATTPTGTVYGPSPASPASGAGGSITGLQPSATDLVDLGRGWTRRWRLRTAGLADATAPGAGPGSSSLLDRVLRVRRIGEQLPTFLEPKLTQLHDPSLMPDMDKAAARLLDALAAHEPIVIYGDYDADGITATTILYHTLRAIDPAARVTSYVPHRLDEGYGLNTQAIEQIAAEGARVIVSVDCGITAIEPAAAARRAGVDLIITDHHNPPESMDQLPAAFAVVHPRRPDSQYPYGDLCGAGVAFKLAWRLATMHATRTAGASGGDAARASPALRSLLVELLAPAALGAIADVVPLTGENRVIARFGLDRIKRSPLHGLRALVDASGLGGANIDTWDCGFKLAPRLNACGRMAHAREAVEMLTTADPKRAATIAAELSRLNTERRLVERRIFEQAAEMAVQAGMTGDDRRAIVLAHPEWHAGVVGIVCSRLVERFGRPTILMADREGVCHGSGRSIDGFNLHAGLHACADVLDKFGGHDMAAGLALQSTRLHELVERFTAVANERISPDELTPVLQIDTAARASDLSLTEVRRIEAMAPFGRGNPPVAVMLKGAVIDAAPVPLGSGGRHLALVVRDGEAPATAPGARTSASRVLRLVGWGWGEGPHHQRLARGMTIDAVVRPNISTYLGRESVEPELLDLRAR